MRGDLGARERLERHAGHRERDPGGQRHVLRDAAVLHASHAFSDVRSDREAYLEKRTSRDLVAEVPSLARIAELDTRHLFHMDSANMQPADWVTIARAVHTELPSYDGVVIVHGTDTMAYTASALALMLVVGAPVKCRYRASNRSHRHSQYQSWNKIFENNLC